MKGDDLRRELTVCWICGNPANSSEHRLKKADLVRAYGRGPYRGESAPVHVREGVQTPIQGPNSSRVKYDQFLCEYCNTTGTQPYDRAYDRFISWVLENESRVLRKRLIDFGEIYGSDFEKPQRDLFKYFVKSFGCRLVHSGQVVPRDLVELLPRDRFRTRLSITICVDEDILLLPDAATPGLIGKGDLLEFPASGTPSAVTGYEWSEYVSWLRTWCWYGRPPTEGLGSRWIANAKVVYLGSLSRSGESEKRS